MAKNTQVYFLNPENSSTVGTTVTSTSTGTTNTTLFTVAAEIIKVKSFLLSIYLYDENGTTDGGIITLSIGDGDFTFPIGYGAIARKEGQSGSATGEINYITISSSDLGFEPGFLQSGDTIVLTVTHSDISTGSTLKVSAIASLEEYTA